MEEAGIACGRATLTGGDSSAGRKVIHIDMDAFFAAIEQRDDPGLRGRPIAVGGSGPRGVVMTASYEARVYGVRSAMPTARALRLCPDLLMVRARFDAYREASRAIHAIFRRWTPLVEPMSLDEAYLDVTEPLPGPMPAVEIARRIKAEIVRETGLTASAGVSYNKFLAKLASDLDKPDGLVVLRPGRTAEFLAGLPIEAFHGVGPATARRLRQAGYRSGADLQQASEAEVAGRLGRFGRALWALARGEDDRPVSPHRARKSLGCERTFETDLREVAAMREVLGELAARLAERQAAAAFMGRTLTLKIKTRDFTLRTRSLTAEAPLLGRERIAALAERLLVRPGPPDGPVRLLGLTLAHGSDAAAAAAQLSFLEPC
jgi:DNA polymerase-4